MFEALVTKLVKITCAGKVIGEMTTEVATSHYGQPEWSGCDVDIGDHLTIEDENGGPAWEADVVVKDEEDGWVLIRAHGCSDPYYAMHAPNGWLTTIEGALPCVSSEDEEVAGIASGLDSGELTLRGTIRLGNGWGCV